MQRFLDEFAKQAEKVLELVRNDFAGIKTGRAKPSLVESVKVQAYNGVMELRELALITAPDPAQIVVSPWDKTILSAIEKGIASAGLNINPIVDGDIIRIAIPPLTHETRQELIKLMHQKLESARVMLRNERAEVKSKIEHQKGEPGVSEDHIKKAIFDLQKKVDEAMAGLEEMGKSKEEELLSIG